MPVVEVREVHRVGPQPRQELDGQRAIVEDVGAQINDGVVLCGAAGAAPELRDFLDRVELAQEVLHRAEAVLVVVDGRRRRRAVGLKALARLDRELVGLQEGVLRACAQASRFPMATRTSGWLRRAKVRGQGSRR